MRGLKNYNRSITFKSIKMQHFWNFMVWVNNVDAYRATLASKTSTKVQNRTDVVNNNNMQSGGGGNVE